MEEAKLYLVSHMGGKSCSYCVVARSKEEAFLQCLSKEIEKNASSRRCCKVEEVKIGGYEIILRKLR